MHLKEFIEKAIEGGWNKYEPTSGIKNISFDRKDKTFMLCDKDNHKCTDPYSYAELVLDPKSWEAVGKVEGWNKYDEKEYFAPEYRNKMHQMIDHLVEGGTIESYIETL